MEDELRENVKNFLLNHDLCRMCILRLLGERQPTAYCKYFDEWRSPGEPDCKRIQRGTCPACLGILEPVYLFEVFEAVSESVALSECQFDDFVLTIAVPPVCLVRQRLAYLNVKSRFADYRLAEDGLSTVKDCVKFVVGRLFEDEFKVAFSPSASFQVNVVLPGGLTPAEHRTISRLVASGGSNKNKNNNNSSSKTNKKNLHHHQHGESLRSDTRTPPSPSPPPPQSTTMSTTTTTTTTTLAPACAPARDHRTHNREHSMKTITSFLQQTASDTFLAEFEFPPKAAACASVEPPAVTCGHLQIYFGGRYCKFSRKLSQTPWLIEGERKMEHSVEELITDVVRKTVVCDRLTFSSSGREDVDVRMLGDGRPFILEVWRPRKVAWSADEAAAIEAEINASTQDISVNRFQLIRREQVKDLKDGEENKRKFYSAHCVSSRNTAEIDFARLASLKGLVLRQNTPMRVLHRRTSMVRERMVHSVDVEVVDAHHFDLNVCTQAGTYVKELVHGDFGRTLPNVCTLLNEAVDIEALDVIKVDLDWPPERGQATDKDGERQ